MEGTELSIEGSILPLIDAESSPIVLSAAMLPVEVPVGFCSLAKREARSSEAVGVMDCFTAFPCRD